MSIKIDDTLQSINKKIKDAIREKIREFGYPKKFIKEITKIEAELDKTIQEILMRSPEFYSLMHDALKLDFGLTNDIAVQLPGLLNLLFSVNFVYEIGVGKDVFNCKLYINCPGEEDENVKAAMRHAAYISPKSKELIDWLRWLLFSGNDVINDSYKVSVIPGKGRSEMGIMMKGSSFSFQVRSEFSGVEGNNFVTRAISRNIDSIINTIKKHLNVT